MPIAREGSDPFAGPVGVKSLEGFDILTELKRIVLSAPGILLAITVHEFAHAYTAFRLGDPTAKNQGRLTFNPIGHLDIAGTILFVALGVGWAKGVPVDPRYFKHPKQDMLWVSLAGPGVNLATAIVLAVLVHVLRFCATAGLVGPASWFVLEPLHTMLMLAVRFNLILMIFNLIPVPPLDGAKIVSGLLPAQQAYRFDQIAPSYGIIVLILLVFTPAANYVLWYPVNLIMTFLLR
jgi:Zn-dependent protease